MAKQRVIKELENPFSTGESFEEIFNSANNSPKEGTVIKGTILNIERDNVIVDIGFKAEGRIPLRDFPIVEQQTIKSGDVIEVFLDRIENSKSEASISREKALREEAWDRLEKVHAKGENVDGIIFGHVKGGFTVDLAGAIAFLPGSQVDVRPVKDISPLMNISQPFQILKMDKIRGNIVVSRRAILEEERSAERADALSNIENGSIIEGIVKNITDYGAFIDLGAIDGLLHVTDISWKRISHPSEILTLGETIKVKVINFDEEKQRISLGLKQLEDSPWKKIEKQCIVGEKYKGNVTNITEYGAFVELQPGIEGLVHVSEMSWTRKNLHPSKMVSTSQEVEVVVLSIDPEKHRLSLGMKQCEPNPWVEFENENKSGTILEGKVKSITEFGIFVGLKGQVDGLVHISDLSWNKDNSEILKTYKKGDNITVKVLEVNHEKERIGLGVKQLENDPFSEMLDNCKKGSIKTVIVSEISDSGIEVEIADGLKSFIKKNDISRDRIECRPDRFSIGDRIDAKVIGVDSDSRQVKLSIKALEMDEQKKAIEQFGSADSGASLGGILGVALDSAKKEAEENKK